MNKEELAEAFLMDKVDSIKSLKKKLSIRDMSKVFLKLLYVLI